MKRRWLILPFLTLAFVLVFTLLPVSFISADTNLVKNSGFNNGLDNWGTEGDVYWGSNYGDPGGGILVEGNDTDSWEGVGQSIDTSNKNLRFSFDYYLEKYESPGVIGIGFNLYKNGGFVDGVEIGFTDQAGHYSAKISEMYSDTHGGADLPPFDEIEIGVGVWDKATAYFDNVKLESSGGGEAEEEEVWVRDHEFQCWQVWVNEANAFEFVFVWEYANNNHVQILDKDGNVVFYIDLPKGGCHFVADLPDGTYTVQNYHEYGHILREFVISKP